MATQGDQDYNRALDAIEAGNLPAALTATESALMNDATQADYWRLYSVLLQQAGRHEDAAKALAKGQELGLDSVDELLLKASLAASEKQWNKAASACEDAIEIDPERPEAWGCYAVNLLEGGYRQDALEAAQRAVELEPLNAQFWYLHGRINRLSKSLNTAASSYQKAVELDPQLALAWYEKGMVHHLQKEFVEAKACFLKAKELNLPDPAVDEALRILEEEAQNPL